jgi:glycine cleavage system protein P-like pyridoxal-binding family
MNSTGFCEAMIAIREEISSIERGASDRQDNPLKRAPHTADLLLADPYGQVLAASRPGGQCLRGPASGVRVSADGGIPAVG